MYYMYTGMSCTQAVMCAHNRELVLYYYINLVDLITAVSI